MSELIERQAAIDAIHCNIVVTGRENAELVAKTMGEFVDRIKALPTIQPVATDTNVGDTISRQAAIDALDFEIVHMTAYCDGKSEGNPLAQYNKGLEDGKKAIEALPPVQPEPKEGHWILHESPDGGEQYECSECGVLWEFNDGTPEDNEAYFCPKCGTKMKGERQK